MDGSVVEIDAKMKVDEINERFDCNLEESERYESIGGLLTAQLGRIPETGVIYKDNGVELKVLEATDRRVVRIRLEKDQE